MCGKDWGLQWELCAPGRRDLHARVNARKRSIGRPAAGRHAPLASDASAVTSVRARSRSGIAEVCPLPTRIVLSYLMLGHNDQGHRHGQLEIPACMAPAGYSSGQAARPISTACRRDVPQALLLPAGRPVSGTRFLLAAVWPGPCPATQGERGRGLSALAGTPND
jgi:hypothetical protein